MTNFKEFFTELYDSVICKECGYPMEECECGKETDTRLYPEEYPYGGYKITDRDIEADATFEYHARHHKHPGKPDITDQYRIAKKELYRRYLASKNNKDKAIQNYFTAKNNLYQRYLDAKKKGKDTL